MPPSAVPTGWPGPQSTAPSTSSFAAGPAGAGPWPCGASWPSSSPWPWPPASPPAHRPDGRPYVWATSLASNEVATYAIAWPYHRTPEQACPRAAPWRVLTVRAVDTVRPITNAPPGGALGSVDLAVPPVEGGWLLGTGGRGRGAWRAYVRQASEDVFELEFPGYGPRPGTGVHAEDMVAESQRDPPLSHPVCHVFR